MASVARVVMASMMTVGMVITSVPVSGAPLAASGARLRVKAGGNATCPWQVSLLDAAGGDGGRQLCTRELSISFGDPPNVAEVPTTSSYSEITAEVPLYLATQSIESDKGSKFKAASAGAGPPSDYECVGGEGFYKLHEKPRLWHEARAACEREGAHLLVLDSAAEARALRRFLASKAIGDEEYPFYTLHAGFGLELVTPQGERVVYENWSSRGAQSPFCGQINNDVWLLSADCSEWRMFICEYDLRPRTLSAAPASLPVPLPTANSSEVKRQLLRDRGYAPLVGWNKTYVKDMGEISSWNEAKMICEKDGTQMVTIDSDEKADALFAFIESSNITMNFYIGVKTGRPVTVLGEPLEDKGYQRWAKKDNQEICFHSDIKLQYYPGTCGVLPQNYGYYHTTKYRSICQANVI
ncbi:hypothetical protein R5R35_005802 [Gryllus longicercus]|uniref:C-type lectin domain-containing protein n=1 Tax=Gryllus longicercus TaxID=2509291 RepID=A0AAN9ZHA4_9ORTH